MTGFHVVRYPLARRPLVSLTLATAGGSRVVAGRRFDLATNLVERLKKTTAYEACEVLVAPSAEVDSDTAKRVAGFGARLVESKGSARTSAIARLNQAAAEARGEFLLLVHDDVEPVTPEWLEMLLEYAQHEEVGAVGGRLLQPNGRIDQTGLVLAGGAPRRAFRGTPGSDAGYFMSAVATRNYSAVSGACLLTRRAVFLDLGGFDEAVGVANADVDYCLRLSTRGLRIVYVPRAELYHLDADCAGPPTPAEAAAFASRWSGVLERDPFYNPNFLQRDRTFCI